MNFSADPSLFAAAQSSLSDALDNVSNAKNTIASLESYPTGYEYTAEVSSSLSNLSKVFTELYQLERKVIRAKDDLVKLDSGWGALYYQVLSSKMDDFMGPLTEEQVYEQETNFDLLVKYADEMFSNEIFKTDPSTWNEEQIKIYLEMLPYIKQVAPYIQNKVDEKTIEKQNINNVNKQILEEKKARYNELIKTFPSSKVVKELEKEITSLEKEIANYEIPLQYGELDSEALKKIRDDLEKNIKEGVFRSFTLSGEEKLEQKSLTAQINVLNQLILYKERVEYFNDLDSQYVNDLDREAKIAAGKERSKHMDANGSKATFAYDEEHILAGFGDSWCFERYMSDEDKEKYYYVLGCNDTFDELGFYEGYDAGLEYLSWFEQSVNDAWGKELGEAQVRAYNNANFIGKAWMTTTTSAQQGLSSAFSGISAATDAFLGYDVNTTISGTDIAASEFRDNLGYWGQKAYDINQTTWNMVPAMSIGGVIPGSSTAIIFAQSYGNNYTEMKRNGYSDKQAHAYSRDAALAEALLESATSSVPGIGWFTQSGAKTYSKLAVDVVEDLVKDAAGEVVQDMTTRNMGNEYLLEENDLSWFTKENLDTFLVSLGSSILMGGASKVNDAVNIADSRAQIEQYVYSATGSEVSYKNLMEMINNNQTDALTSALSIVHPSQTLGVVETIGNNNLNAYVSNLNDSNIENFTNLFGGARNSYDVINQLNQDNQVKVYEGMDSSSFQSVYELMSDKTQSKVQGMLGQEVFDAKMVDANELSSKHQNVFKSMLNNLGFSKLNAKNFVNYSQNVTEINSCLNQNTQLTESQQSIVNAVNSNINKGLNSVINVNSTSELSTIMLSQIKDLSMVNIRINGGFVDLNGNMKSKYNSQKYIDRVTYTGYEAISIVSRIEQLQGMVDMNLPLKQRAQQIYDILASEYNYAYDYNNYTNGHSIVGSLRGLTSNSNMGKEGLVCAGYAQAYKELCERCGITCEYIRGDSVRPDGKHEKHAWNVVLINGEVIPVDVTWHSGSNQNWFGASDLFAETHKADADEVYNNYNVVASSIDVDLASVISNHNLKYGEGQGILALNEVARTGNYNCITSMNGARETLSKYSLDQIREYVNRNNMNNVNEVVTVDTKIKGDIDTALVLHDMKYGLDSGRKALEALVKDGDYNKITSTNGARSIISQYSIEQINAYLNGNVVDGNELSAINSTRMYNSSFSSNSINLEQINDYANNQDNIETPKRLSLSDFDLSKGYTINELADLLQEDGFTILGHGTGGNNVSVINPIMENGLRCSHTSLLYTSIGLDTSNLSDLQGKLNNWQHQDSENIILIRLPNEYFNMRGESMDLNCERTGAFVNEVVDESGNVTYYLDPKFIIGAYNRNTGEVTINPGFEQNLSEESINELKEKYAKTDARIDQRLDSIEDSFNWLENRESTEESIEQKSFEDASEWTNFDDWDAEFDENNLNSENVELKTENTAMNNVEILTVANLNVNQKTGGLLVKETSFDINKTYGDYDYVIRPDGNFSDVVNNLSFDNTKKYLIELSSLRDVDVNVLENVPENIQIRIIGGYTQDFMDGFDKKSSTRSLQQATYTAEELTKIFQKIVEIESGIDESWNDYQKAYYVYEYLKNNLNYVAQPGFINSRHNRFDSLTALIYMESTCIGNAYVYKELLNRLGIECDVINGALDGVGGHGYNVVTIDGNSFIVDTVRQHLKNYDGTGFGPVNYSEYVPKSSNKYVQDRVNSANVNNDNNISKLNDTIVNNSSERIEVINSTVSEDINFVIENTEGSDLGNVLNSYSDEQLKNALLTVHPVNVTNFFSNVDSQKLRLIIKSLSSDEFGTYVKLFSSNNRNYFLQNTNYSYIESNINNFSDETLLQIMKLTNSRIEGYQLSQNNDFISRITDVNNLDFVSQVFSVGSAALKEKMISMLDGNSLKKVFDDNWSVVNNYFKNSNLNGIWLDETTVKKVYPLLDTNYTESAVFDYLKNIIKNHNYNIKIQLSSISISNNNNVQEITIERTNGSAFKLIFQGIVNVNGVELNSYVYHDLQSNTKFFVYENTDLINSLLSTSSQYRDMIVDNYLSLERLKECSEKYNGHLGNYGFVDGTIKMFDNGNLADQILKADYKNQLNYFFLNDLSLSQDQVSDKSIIDLISKSFERTVQTNDLDEINIMKAFIKLKSVFPNLTLKNVDENVCCWNLGDMNLNMTKSSIAIGDYGTTAHEVGHLLFCLTLNEALPTDFKNIVSRAQQFASDANNTLLMERYIQYISQSNNSLATINVDKNIKDIGKFKYYFAKLKENRQALKGNNSYSLKRLYDLTKSSRNDDIAKERERLNRVDNSEYCAVSDMLDALFYGKGVNNNNKKLFITYGHRGYYKDKVAAGENVDVAMLHEQIANFSQLKRLGATAELDLVKTTFGDEFYNMLESIYQEFVTYGKDV